MDEQTRQDLRISGSMNLPGGCFAKVSVNGDATLSSDVDCTDFVVNGKSLVKGDLKTSSFKVNGKASIEGDISADLMRINGSAEIFKNAKVKHLRVAGSVEVNGDVSSEFIDMYGGLQVKGDCMAEHFKAHGAFNISGMMNAGTIEVRLHHYCRAKEIGGEKISVKYGQTFNFKKIINMFFPGIVISHGLEVDIIECDDIYLENVKAKTVRGNIVVIGRDCEIDAVEYKSHYEKASNSVVRTEKKV